MRKRVISKTSVLLFYFSMTLPLYAGGEITVTTFAELKAAIDNNHNTPIHLDAPVFMMTGHVVLAYDCQIDTIYDGNVLIDANNNWRWIIRDCTCVISGPEGGYKLTFTHGGVSDMEIRSEISATNVTFNYCDFSESTSFNGLVITGPMASTVDVVCNNCRAFNNYNDGFSIASDALEHRATLTLNDCQACGNDPLRNGGAAGDGATAHKPNQKVIIKGGRYYQNNKGGIAMAGGSSLSMYGGTQIYDNSLTTDIGNVYIEGDANISDAHFWITASGRDTTMINVINSRLVVYNCTFDGTNSTVSYMMALAGDSSQQITDFAISNCIFHNKTATGRYIFALTDEGITGIVTNCVFYNNTKVFNLSTSNVTFTNNIFMNNTECVFQCYDNEYSGNHLNGYNVFYNNNHDFYNDAGGLRPTDMVIDPCFVDGPNGDYHLKSQGWRWDAKTNQWTWDEVTSRCIDAGNPGQPTGSEPLAL